MRCVGHKYDNIQRKSMLVFNTRYNLLLIQKPNGQVQDHVQYTMHELIVIIIIIIILCENQTLKPNVTDGLTFKVLLTVHRAMILDNCPT